MAEMDLFDDRIYRTLTIKGTSKNRGELFIVPGVTQMTYAGSYYESPAAAIQSGIDKIEELNGLKGAEHKAFITLYASS